jgi:PPOX class probable FMN-dependent enzyme
MPAFRDRLDSEDDLRALVTAPPPDARPWQKEIPALDDHCRAFIAHSPFVVLATAGPDGRCDASPRGGPPGFVTVLDDHRLAFADLPGNRRQDSHRNLIANGRAALLFMVPGRGETLRVNGRACLTRDPEVLEAVRLDGARPTLAFGMEVEVAFLHCAKALLRSRLWSPDDWLSLQTLPSSAAMLRDHVSNGVTLEGVDEALRESYATTLWWREPDGSPANSRTIRR